MQFKARQKPRLTNLELKYCVFEFIALQYFIPHSDAHKAQNKIESSFYLVLFLRQYVLFKDTHIHSEYEFKTLSFQQTALITCENH